VFECDRTRQNRSRQTIISNSFQESPKIRVELGADWPPRETETHDYCPVLLFSVQGILFSCYFGFAVVKRLARGDL